MIRAQNHGKKWDSEQDHLLKQKFKNINNENLNKFVNDLSNIFGRSNGSIFARLRMHNLIEYDSDNSKYIVLDNSDNSFEKIDNNPDNDNDQGVERISDNIFVILPQQLLNMKLYYHYSKILYSEGNSNTFRKIYIQFPRSKTQIFDRGFMEIQLDKNSQKAIERLDSYIRNIVNSGYQSSLKIVNGEPILKVRLSKNECSIYDSDKNELKYDEVLKYKNYSVIPIIEIERLWKNSEGIYFCIMSVRAFKVFPDKYHFDVDLFID
jgi:hypothetical protein